MALPRTDDPWNHLAGAAVCVRAALCTAPPDRLLPGRAATNPQAELFTVPTDGHNGRRCFIVATGDERAVRSSAGLLASTRLRTPAPCLKTLARTRESCAESLANAACPSGWCGRPALGHPASGIRHPASTSSGVRGVRQSRCACGVSRLLRRPGRESALSGGRTADGRRHRGRLGAVGRLPSAPTDYDRAIPQPATTCAPVSGRRGRGLMMRSRTLVRPCLTAPPASVTAHRQSRSATWPT